MECLGNGADLRVHEDDVSRFYGRIGTAVHSRADIGTGQDRCIVDAVTDEHDRAVLFAKFIQLTDLILRQEFSPNVIDSRLRSDVIGSLLRIAGKHGRRNPQAGNGLDGIDSVFFQRVGNDDSSGILTVDGNEQFGTVFSRFQRRKGKLMAVHELLIAAEDVMAFDNSFQTMAGNFFNL